jgi:hypothetical protein
LTAYPSVGYFFDHDAADRFHLLGTYTTPRGRIGHGLTCAARDCDLMVVDYVSGHIPWPLGPSRGMIAKPHVAFGD